MFSFGRFSEDGPREGAQLCSEFVPFGRFPESSDCPGLQASFGVSLPPIRALDTVRCTVECRKMFSPAPYERKDG